MQRTKLERMLAVYLAAIGLGLVMQAALAQPQPDGGQDKVEASKPARAEPDNSPGLTKQVKLQHTLVGHKTRALSLAFNPDGKTLVSVGCYHDSVRLWDVTLGKERSNCRRDVGCITSAAFSPDGKTLASAVHGGPVPAPGNVTLWEVATGQRRAVLKGHGSDVLAEAFSPDGKLLASAGEDQTVNLWEVATAKMQATLLGHQGAVYAVAFSPDGKVLASASKDNTIILWDVVTGKKQAILRGHTRTAAFSPDGKTLASASDDKTVKLWEVATGKERATLRGHTDEVTSVTYHPSGNLLASGGRDHTIKVWDVTTGKEYVTLQGHTKAVCAVAYSRDGTLLASGSEDKSIKIWKMPARQRAEAINLTPEALLGLWATLAGDDAQKAYEASNTLIRASEQATVLIKERLGPVAEPSQQELTRLIADLDSDQFALRRMAMEALEKLGDRVEQSLREKQGEKLSLEVRARIKQLLTVIDQQPLTAEQRLGVRAVEVLERIGSVEARKVLETLSAGAASARLTREARASLQRNRASN